MILIAILSVTLIGVLFINLFYKKWEIQEIISLGFLVGISLFTLEMFYVNWLGVVLNVNTLSYILIGSVTALSIVNVLVHKNVKFLKPTNTISQFLGQTLRPKINLVIVLVILYFLGSSLLSNVYWPVRDWDALTLYDFRAKMFADTGSISEVFKIHRYYLAYPLFTSLMHAFVYIFDYQNPLFMYSFIYIGFLTLFYTLLKRRTDNVYALLITAIVSFTYPIFEQSKIAYTNLPYASFLVISYLYLLNWFEENKWGSLILSVVFASLSTWIRSSEPFWVTSIIMILIFSRKFKIKATILYLLGVFLVRIPWDKYVAIQGSIFPVKSSLDLKLLQLINVDLLINRVIEVAIYFWIYVVKPEFILLLMYIISFFLFNNRRISSKYLFSTVVTSLLIVFAGIFFVSLVYPKWTLIGDSVSRMSLFLTPLIVFSLGDLLYKSKLLPKLK